MKFLIGLTVFAAIIWYGFNNLNWGQYIEQKYGQPMQEIQDMFNPEKAKEKARIRQQKINNFQ